jgi:hypothetical protein
MLIKMHVFDKMTYPYFAEPIIENELIPEDNYFCLKLHDAGFDIWCHLNLSLAMGHVGYKEYKIDTVPAIKQTNEVITLQKVADLGIVVHDGKKAA